MTKHFCDKCGKESKSLDRLVINPVYMITMSIMSGSSNKEVGMLCSSCIRDLYKWLKNN